MELSRIERTMDRRRRSCGFDRNDLRRGMDRWQWFIGLLLLTAGIAVASVAALVDGADLSLARVIVAANLPADLARQ